MAQCAPLMLLRKMPPGHRLYTTGSCSLQDTHDLQLSATRIPRFRATARGQALGVQDCSPGLRSQLWGLHLRVHSQPYLSRKASIKLHVAKADAVMKRNPKRLKYQSSYEESNTLYLEVKADGSDAWRLDPIADMIKAGAVGVIPTDTMYAFVCDLKNTAAIERLYRIKSMDPKKPLSILCRSFQDIDMYTLGFPRGNSQGQSNIFRLARQCLPGPFTFILKASKDLPKQCTHFGGSEAAHCAPRKSVGVRMPDDPICLALLSRLDQPLLCTSVTETAPNSWMLDPIYIRDKYGSKGQEGVDFVINGGVRIPDPSTVVDMTADTPVLLRRGKGDVEDWMLLEPNEDSSANASLRGRINPYASSSESLQ